MDGSSVCVNDGGKIIVARFLAFLCIKKMESERNSVIWVRGLHEVVAVGVVFIIFGEVFT